MAVGAGAVRSRYTRLGEIFGSLVLVMTCAASLAWAGMAPITGAVVAPGSFVVTGERQKVQHRDGGVIAKILVNEGDQVSEGQVLVEFDTRELEIKQAQLEKANKALAERLDLVKDEFAGVRKLYDRDLVAKPRYLALKRDMVDIKAQRDDNLLKLSDVKVQLGRAAVTAPRNGKVVQLAIHTVGGVARPGETIMELVPSTAPLLIEARISPQQVDDVTIGMPVEVRLSGLNQKTTPTLRGRLVHVSADALLDEKTGQTYFTTRSELSPETSARFKLAPGMPAEVMIETGRRTVLEYAMKPLIDSASRALREP